MPKRRTPSQKIPTAVWIAIIAMVGTVSAALANSTVLTTVVQLFGDSPTATANIAPTNTSTPLDTPTLPPTVPIDTATPTITPHPVITDAPQATPLPAKDFSDNCIDSSFWKTFPASNIYPKNDKGCWQLAEIGMNAQDGGLLIFMSNSPSNQLRGVYRPIPDNAKIRLKLRIDKFTSNGNNPGILGIGIEASNVGKMLYYRVNGYQSPVLTLLGDWGFENSSILSREYTFGTEKTIEFSINGLVMNIAIDGTEISEPINASSLAGVPKAFYIVHSLRSVNELQAFISEFQVEEP